MKRGRWTSIVSQEVWYIEEEIGGVHRWVLRQMAEYTVYTTRSRCDV